MQCETKAVFVKQFYRKTILRVKRVREVYTVDPKVRVDSPFSKETGEADNITHPIFERPDSVIKRKDQTDIM